MHKALLSGLTGLICIGCYEGHEGREPLAMDEGSTGTPSEASSDGGEAIVEPDDSEPGQLRAQRLDLLER